MDYNILSKSIRVLTFLLFLSAAVPALAAGERSALSLSDALDHALNHNHDIQSLAYDMRIAEAGVEDAASSFIPAFEARGAWRRDAWDTPTIDGYKETDMLDGYVSLNKKNRYGGIASVNAGLDLEEYSYLAFPAEPQEHGAHVYLKYVQPLLKGFGKEIALLDVRKAEIQKQFTTRISRARENQLLFDVFYNYFTAYAMIEEVAINHDIREKTQTIHDVVKEKVDMRTLPITDLNKMKSTLLNMDRAILGLENRTQHQLNTLMLMIYNDAGTCGRHRMQLTTPPRMR